ncbi:MAG: hypothetical protein HYY97_03105 [Rhodocyclales bacterium]|nr:hypothetical protein [Rhodocyclales bacterium]
MFINALICKKIKRNKEILFSVCNTRTVMGFLLIGLVGCSPDNEKSISQKSQETQLKAPNYPKWKLRASGTKDTAKEDGFTSCDHIKYTGWIEHSGLNETQKNFRCAHEQPYSLLGISIGVPYVLLSSSSQYKYEIVKFDIQAVGIQFKKEKDLCKGEVLSFIGNETWEISKGNSCRNHFKSIKMFQENLKSDGWLGYYSKEECSCSYSNSNANCIKYVRQNTPTIIEVAYISQVIGDAKNNNWEVKPFVCLKGIAANEADKIYINETNATTMETKRKADDQADREKFIRSMSK